MKFSQRIGKKEVKTLLQVEAIDSDLLNRLWNVLLEDFFNKLSDYAAYGSENQKGEVCMFIWKEHFNYPIDTIPHYNDGTVHIENFIRNIREWFFEKAEWFDVYDLIEFISILDSKSLKTGFTSKCNLALEREVSGYRIVNEKVVQITSKEEIEEIGNAIKSSDKWDSVNTHLKTALDFLADRKNPNYRNSIKESISAVESLCIIITGDKKATLGNALNQIEKTHALHGALKNSFAALYGYTSDSSGIRHALLEDSSKVTFEDAKFMLVSCSAFINYLKTKMNI